MSEKCPKCGAVLTKDANTGDWGTWYECGSYIHVPSGRVVEGPNCFHRQLAKFQEENARLKAALEPFADCFPFVMQGDLSKVGRLTLAQFRAAAEAARRKKPETPKETK